VETLGWEGSYAPMPEPLWLDDVVVVASPFLGMVAAVDEEVVRPVALHVGSEDNVTWSARHSVLRAHGVRFLGCTCLHVKVDSS
jgi:hypothetical protein